MRFQSRSGLMMTATMHSAEEIPKMIAYPALDK